MRCQRCDEPMNKKSDDEWECGFCGMMAYGTEDDYYFDDDDSYSYDSVYGEDFACKSCGNPNYPKCKTSCLMFDDE